MEVKLPKPGDQLPFVVAETEKVKLSYSEGGVLQAWCQDVGWLSESSVYAIAELLEIPKRVYTAVATTIEGGGE